MEWLMVLGLAAVVAVLPVMLAARMVGAGRTGFGPALLAVILQAVCSGVAERYLGNGWAGIAVAIVLGVAIYAYVLDTSWIKGLVLGILAIVLSALAAIALAMVLS